MYETVIFVYFVAMKEKVEPPISVIKKSMSTIQKVRKISKAVRPEKNMMILQLITATAIFARVGDVQQAQTLLEMLLL